MGFLNRLLTFLLGIATFFGVLFLIATTYGWEKVWEYTSGSPDMGSIQFEGFTKGPKPNQVLFCPDGLCSDNSRDSKSPVYSIPVAQLQTEFLGSLQHENSLERVDKSKHQFQMRFVQRTRILRFPDTIRVRFFALGTKQSTIALYSQSPNWLWGFGRK